MSPPDAMSSRDEQAAYSPAEFNSLHLKVFSKCCGQLYFDRPHLVGKRKDGRQQVHIKKKTFIPLQLTAVMVTFKTKPANTRALLPSFITVSRHGRSCDAVYCFTIVDTFLIGSWLPFFFVRVCPICLFVCFRSADGATSTRAAR